MIQFNDTKKKVKVIDNHTLHPSEILESIY